MNKQFAKELAAFSLFLISWFWILGTAGASDTNRISIGQSALQLGIGTAGLYISVRLINKLSRKEESDGEEN